MYIMIVWLEFQPFYAKLHCTDVKVVKLILELGVIIVGSSTEDRLHQHNVKYTKI